GRVTPCADRQSRYAWNAAALGSAPLGVVVVVPVVGDPEAALAPEPPPHPAASTARPTAPRTAATLMHILRLATVRSVRDGDRRGRVAAVLRLWADDSHDRAGTDGLHAGRHGLRHERARGCLDERRGARAVGDIERRALDERHRAGRAARSGPEAAAADGARASERGSGGGGARR